MSEQPQQFTVTTIEGAFLTASKETRTESSGSGATVSALRCGCYVEPGRLLAATLTDAADALESAAVREQRLRAALEEALDRWENAAIYKGAALIVQHGDAEDIARLRALAGDAIPAKGCEPSELSISMCRFHTVLPGE